jgi:hypothetical protein
MSPSGLTELVRFEPIAHLGREAERARLARLVRSGVAARRGQPGRLDEMVGGTQRLLRARSPVRRRQTTRRGQRTRPDPSRGPGARLVAGRRGLSVRLLIGTAIPVRVRAALAARMMRGLPEMVEAPPAGGHRRRLGRAA